MLENCCKYDRMSTKKEFYILKKIWDNIYLVTGKYNFKGVIKGRSSISL